MSIHEKLIVIDTTPITVMTGSVSMDGTETVLGKDGHTLPKEACSSMGTKIFMDKQVLRKLHACRNRLVAYLESVSIRYLGGFAAPIELKDEILKKVAEETATFNEIKEKELIAHYNEHVESWCSQFPAYAKQLRDSAPSLEKVERRNTFGVNVFQVMPLEGEAAIAADAQMGETLIREVNRDARNLFNESFRGKTEVTRKAVSAIERLAQKLKGLAFLDNRAMPMAIEVLSRISRLPAHGPYKDSWFTEVSNIVLLLAMEVDLSHEKEILAQAAAAGVNLMESEGATTNIECGRTHEETTDKTEVEPCTATVPEAESTKSAEESQVTQKQPVPTDLFDDLDAMLGSHDVEQSTRKEVIREAVATTQVESEAEHDDYFSDQFAFA